MQNKSILLKNQKRKAKNKSRKSLIKTCTKRFFLAVEQKDYSLSQKLFIIAQSNIMKAVSRNLLKKNNASRKVSMLMKKFKSCFKEASLRDDMNREIGNSKIGSTSE